MPISENWLGVGVKIVELGAEMIIDHIKVDDDVVLVGGTQQPLEILRASIMAFGALRSTPS
jgi:hypothetical protein